MNNIEELRLEMADAPEMFNHLKILLYREHTKLAPEFGRRFLFVSPSGHVIVFRIDIGDKKSTFLMIAWEDILDIVNQEKKYL